MNKDSQQPPSSAPSSASSLASASARSFAIGEVESLVLKAYRGAGFTWGMAQEAGKAAGWLSRRQMPALDAFATLLEQTVDRDHAELAPGIDVRARQEVWTSTSGLLCPVITGVFLSDAGATLADKASCIRLASVASPLILLPYIAALPVAVTMKAAELEIRGGTDAAATAAMALALSGCHEITLQVMRGQLQVGHANLFSAGPDNAPVRGAGTAASVALLERLAHKTYVPATQESRESGAGAGLQDND